MWANRGFVKLSWPFINLTLKSLRIWKLSESGFLLYWVSQPFIAFFTSLFDTSAVFQSWMNLSTLFAINCSADFFAATFVFCIAAEQTTFSCLNLCKSFTFHFWNSTMHAHTLHELPCFYMLCTITRCFPKWLRLCVVTFPNSALLLFELTSLTIEALLCESLLFELGLCWGSNEALGSIVFHPCAPALVSGLWYDKGASKSIKSFEINKKLFFRKRF